VIAGTPLSDYPRLLGLHRAEFERAKADQKWAWSAATVGASVAVFAIFSSPAVVTYLLTMLAVVCEAARWFFAWRSRSRHDAAERGRRVVLLIKGLGWQISGRERAELLQSFSASEAEGKQWEDPTYFHRDEPPGPSYLVRLMQESVFWSEQLFRATATVLWLITALALVVAIGVLLALPYVPKHGTAVIVTRATCIILTLLFSLDMLGMAIDYTRAASALRDIDARLAAIELSAPSVSDVVPIFGDYNAIVERVPPILTSLYQRRHEQITRLWSARTGASHP
jgi:hypothetical protein